MNIGYACLAIAVPGSELKNCILKYADDERLLSLIEHNLISLDKIIDYNIQNAIKLFRISSDLIPFGSSMASELPWQDVFSEKLKTIGLKIQGSGMRVSMHPGQYTVLNSPDESVALRAIKDLEYHCKVLDSLDLGCEHKLILHTGGAYGDKKQSANRFILRYSQLSQAVKSRLVLENDDKLFNIKDVLDIALQAGIPVVYDSFHNAVNPADKFQTDIDWIEKCSKTWQKQDGPQKIHYSQHNPHKKPGAHSDSIEIDRFRDFYEDLSGMDIDIMLEVKDKNLSALKCLNCTSNRGIGALVSEWAHYEHCVLERSFEEYNAILDLLKDKAAYPALEMYRMIEQTLRKVVVNENAINTAQQVFEYFKENVTECEARRFQKAMQSAKSGAAGIQPVKNILFSLAKKYQQNYLLNGYYFYI